jgi:hypothetical protein
MKVVFRLGWLQEAEAKATTTRDLGAKIMYEDIAKHYRYLAEQQGRMESYARRSKKQGRLVSRPASQSFTLAVSKRRK